ncbi:MAG: sterol desaturase family protein [Deltaproteobacteria bacterium]|nr:sterol desaturase family protein [Deltaproteobacteria bacterium]
MLVANEVAVRLSFFLGIFFAVASWEALAPRRSLTQRKGTRWLNNLGLTLLNALLLRLAFPAAAVGVALYGAAKEWGLLQAIPAPVWAGGLLAIVVLDLAIYAQHLLFHKVPLLWRLHRMHHTDLDIDVTTGARFHPLEILLSMGIKMGIIITLGAPAWSVIVFEVLLNATSMFNHGNVLLKRGTDRALRFLVVTPDMHRVHHSVIIRETDSNFGFNFPWWDRLFGTYRAEPAAGHDAMTIGLANYRDPKWLKLPWMLVVPFARRER